MHYIVSIITAIILLGCSGDEPAKQSSTAATQTQTATKAEADTKSPVAEKEPTGLQKTVTPQLNRNTETAAIDGASLYKKCASCHGANAEKPALGKSKVIAGWSKAQTEEVLKGYKDGSYGGAMKALMQTQVKTLNDEEIKALAEFIGKL